MKKIISETGKKLSGDERYKMFFNKAFDGFYVVELNPPIPTGWGLKKQLNALMHNSRIAECNKSFAKMYGTSNCSELIGKTMFEIYGSELNEINAEINSKFIKNGYRLKNDITSEKDLKGNVKYFVNNSSGIVENGKLVSFWGTQKDVTDIIEMQNELKVSEELLRSIFESVQDGIFIKDKEEKFILANQAFVKKIKKSKKTIIGRTSKEIFGENFSVAVVKYDKQALKGKEVSYKVHRNIGGKNVILHVTKTPLRNADGEIVGILGIGRDITESETISIKLAEREKEFETLVNVNPVPMLVADDKFNTRLVNQQFVKTFGYNKEDIPALDSWLEKAYPNVNNIKRIKREWVRELKKTLNSRRKIHYTESVVTCKNGSKKNIEFYATLIGNLTIVSFVDITEKVRVLHALEKSEQYYKTIFFNAPYGIFHFDKEGNITSCNDIFVKIIGSTKKALIGLNVLTQIKDQNVISAVKKMLRVGSASYQDYYSSVTSGKVTPIRVQFKGIKSESGEIIGGVGVVEDITKQIESEKALKQSEQKYKRIFDGVSDAIFIHEPDSTKIIDINVRVTQMYGYSRKEVIGNSLAMLSVSESNYDNEAALVLINKAVNKPQRFEWLGRDKKGRIFWVEVNLRKILINGEIKVLAAVKDIDRRKKAVNSLMESEARIRLLLESLPDAIVVHIGGVFAFVNKAAVKLVGAKSKKDLIGKSVLPFVHPEYRQFAINRMRSTKKIIPTAEEKFLTTDGRTVYVEVSGVKLTFNQKPATQLVIRDITEKRKQQAVQEALFEISQAAVTARNLKHFFKNVHDILKKIIFAKNFYIALYDKSKNELSFPYFVDEYDEPPKPRPFGKGFTEYVIKKGKSVFIDTEKDKKLRKSGEVELIGEYSKLWLGVVLKYQKEIIGVMAIQDYHSADMVGKDELKILTFVSEQIAQVIVKINAAEEKEQYLKELRKAKTELEKQTVELRKVNKELRESEEKLKITNANKDKFFSIVSHDLRSPFSALIGYAQLLTDNYDQLEEDEIHLSLSSLKRSAENTYSLLNGLLEWSRTQTGRMEFNPRYYKPYKIVDEIIELLRVSADNKQINLISKVSRDLKAFVDRKMLETILRNLISNAIKFTNPGGKILIEASEKDDEIVMRIIDNGMGIEPEDLKRLFKIEEHLTTVGTENEVGTGIGLILCKELVEKMGGKIWAESKINKGTTFHFTLKNKK